MSEYTSIVCRIILLFVILFGLTFCIGTAYAIDKEFRKCAGCHKIEQGKRPPRKSKFYLQSMPIGKTL